LTDAILQDPEAAAAEIEIRRHFRWNFGVNVLDGALFWLGMSFAAASTVMPLYVSHLTDSRVLIGLAAAITASGWSLPQLLTANYVEQMPVKKNMVIRTGFFTERLPLVVMAASVFLFAQRSPGVALWLFFLTLAWHTLGAGLIAVAWQDMVAKVIPVEYRGRMLGLANGLGTAGGIAGSGASALILARYPFPTNFALCMSLMVVFILASWVAVALTREPALHSLKPSVSMREYARRLPEVLRRDHNFAIFLLSRVVTVFGKMGVGFLTVYAVQRWGLTDSQAGLYTTALLAGEVIASTAGGVLADRRGHKLVLQVSVGLLTLAMVTALLAPDPRWMYAVFVGIGAMTATDILSGIMISLEFSAPADRPTYVGLANTVPGLFALVGPLIGGWIASRAGYHALFLTAAVLSLASLAVLCGWVREPRQAVAG